jgi:O-antigen ligase
MLMSLPLIGSLFVKGNKRERLIVIMAAPLALNVLLLCNSRGAFLGLGGAGLAFLLVARGATRKKAIRALLLGSVALYLLLGNPKILDRFSTTFVGSEERDTSAASRLVFWQAGIRMIRDYPLGAGGGAFKYVHGSHYIAEVTGSDEVSRSLHNGYLTEATDWGLQGLLLKLLFFGAAIVAAYQTSTRCRLEGRLEEALVGVCMIAGAMGFLTDCVFGSFLGNEWGYWVVALLVRYQELYKAADTSAGTVVPAAATSRGVPQVAA